MDIYTAIVLAVPNVFLVWVLYRVIILITVNGNSTDFRKVVGESLVKRVVDTVKEKASKPKYDSEGYDKNGENASGYNREGFRVIRYDDGEVEVLLHDHE